MTDKTQRSVSGEKVVHPNGTRAIKDGIKKTRKAQDATQDKAPAPVATERKPPWIRVRIGGGQRYKDVQDIVHTHSLATVCEESHCPNIAECWNHGTATIMLMGAVCTRACKFCSVDTGNPQGWLDAQEPHNAAESVRLMGLKYVVLTSVDRDDLADGGAAHYAACIKAIKATNPNTGVEALTPDFNGDRDAVTTVVTASLDVFAQNIETVRRLTRSVRDVRAGYDQTLSVLAHAKTAAPQILTKSSLIVGLGETDEEIITTMQRPTRAPRRRGDLGAVPTAHCESPTGSQMGNPGTI